MSDRSRVGRRIAAGVALGTLLAAASLGPSVAHALTQTKFDSASATWSSATSYVGVADTATVTLGNELTSNQTFGSAELTFNTVPSSGLSVVAASVPSGWSAKVLSGTPGVVLLTSNKGAAVTPGSSISVQVAVTPAAAGTLTIGVDIKQSNNFSGSGNDFISDSTSGLSITVIALTLKFAQQPATIAQSLPGAAPPYFTYFCNPVSVQLYNGTTALAAGGINVTVKHGGTTNPGLYYGTAAVGTTGVTVSTDATGLATFGTCSSGLAATVVGTGYTLSASSPAASSAVTSTSFDVTQTCDLTCTDTATSGTTGTTGTVTGTGDGIFQLFTAFGEGIDLSCDSAITKAGAPVDPLSVTATSTGAVSGTITMVFPKSVVNSLTNNGTPQMPVCAGAAKPFPAQGDPTTGLPFPGSTAFPYQGLLYNCTDPTYLADVASGAFPDQLCVQSRSKIGGGAEQIVIFANDITDPSFW